MIRGEVLFENEEFINIVEDTVEERTQKIWLAIDVLHLFECFLINLLFRLIANRRECP